MVTQDESAKKLVQKIFEDFFILPLETKGPILKYKTNFFQEEYDIKDLEPAFSQYLYFACLKEAKLRRAYFTWKLVIEDGRYRFIYINLDLLQISKRSRASSGHLLEELSSNTHVVRVSDFGACLAALVSLLEHRFQKGYHIDVWDRLLSVKFDFNYKDPRFHLVIQVIQELQKRQAKLGFEWFTDKKNFYRYNGIEYPITKNGSFSINFRE